MQDIVKFTNADICQQDQTVVLQNINLRIGEGEFTYLIGKTGSGKSSLLKTMYAALPLERGSGEVAGFDLKTIHRSNVHLLRRKLGIRFQDVHPLPDRSVLGQLGVVYPASGCPDAAAISSRVFTVP